MSKRHKGVRSLDEKPHTLDRRAALERTVVGGAALAVAMFGGLPGTGVVPADAQQPQSPCAGQPWLTGRVRRVVTGHNAQGRSCVVSDEMTNIGYLWTSSADEPLGTVPAGEARGIRPTTAPKTDPAVGGSRLSLGTIQPWTQTKPTAANRIGFHRTVTIDYVLVLSGELVLVLDEQEVKLNAGDFVVQRNTDHGWRNDGKVPAHYLATLVRVNG